MCTQMRCDFCFLFYYPAKLKSLILHSVLKRRKKKKKVQTTTNWKMTVHYSDVFLFCWRIYSNIWISEDLHVCECARECVLILKCNRFFFDFFFLKFEKKLAKRIFFFFLTFVLNHLFVDFYLNLKLSFVLII